MKIFYLLSAALLLGAGSLSAQSKIDARGRQLLDLYKAGQLSLNDSQAFLAAPASRSSVAMTDVMVETTDGAVLDSLRSCGYTVEYISPSFSLVCMPSDDIEALAGSPAVRTLSFGHVCEPLMDEARAASNVNGVHSGLGIAYQGDRRHSFRGDNVIVGMFDTGFDPGHVNFLNEAGTDCRIKFYARFTGSSTTPTVYQGDQVRQAPSDNGDETHGTHVAGIMGGAYNGSGTYYKKDANGIISNAGKLPLYGVAPNADLAICAGPLYNNSILAGIRRLINYANSVGKPIAINLSLGHNHGPHDGSDSFSRQLDELAKEAIICVAAGNEGADNIHGGTTFTDAKKDLKMAFSGNKYSAGYIVDVWSTTTDEIKVSVILAKKDGEIVAKITSENGRTIVTGSGTTNDHTIFKNSFDGSISMTALRDGNRYNVQLSSSSEVKAKSGVDYVLGLMVEGNSGVRVDVYGNSYVNFTANVPTGFDRPDANGSVSGMACGFNTIVVGSYSSRAQYIDLTGSTRSTGGGSGNLATYSSWGELIDGRQLPHITAPGTGIISSYNGYLVRKSPESMSYVLCASTDEGGQKHYWGSMNGTSMATPYVTGSMGLWLEADPSLTGTKARDIMTATAKRESGMDGVTAWGAGKIQVLNGIKEVIARMEGGGVGDVATEASKVLVSTNGLSVEVLTPASGIHAELYNISGQKVAEAYGADNSLALEAPSAGIYIVNVRAGSANYTGKVALR